MKIKMFGKLKENASLLLDDAKDKVKDTVKEKISDNFDDFLEKNNLRGNEIQKNIEEIGVNIEEIGIFVFPPYLRLNFDIKNSTIDMLKLQEMSKNDELDKTSHLIIKQFPRNDITNTR
jgi:hypothetical protein